MIAKFQAEVFVLGSYLSKAGKIDVLERVNDFTLLKKDGTKKEKEDKKLPPVGSFEKIMNIFGGGR